MARISSVLYLCVSELLESFFAHLVADLGYDHTCIVACCNGGVGRFHQWFQISWKKERCRCLVEGEFAVADGFGLSYCAIESVDVILTSNLFSFLYLQMGNAYDSPSIIKFNKDVDDPNHGGDPFNSPSALINGGDSDSKYYAFSVLAHVSVSIAFILLLFLLRFLFLFLLLLQSREKKKCP